jgi:hypothetical protein
MTHGIIAAALAAVQTGTEPWQTVIDAQQIYYPRCAAHDTPTPMVLDDEPICIQCIAERGDAIRAQLQTYRL